MSILGQFQTFIRQARRDTLAQLAQCMTAVLLERALSARRGPVSPAERQRLAQEAQETVQRLPRGQLGTRFLAQGGWVSKDTEQRMLHVTLKPLVPCWCSRRVNACVPI